jgi:hypothetical protein
MLDSYFDSHVVLSFIVDRDSDDDEMYLYTTSKTTQGSHTTGENQYSSFPIDIFSSVSVHFRECVVINRN